MMSENNKKASAPSQDSQLRKALLTINNPGEKGITQDSIERRLMELNGLEYFCLSKEIGREEQTEHFHVYAVYRNPKKFSTWKNKFPEAHIDRPLGNNAQNRDYVFKQGKWAGSEKEDTRIDGTQYEYGTLPPDRNSRSPELEKLYAMIKDGMSNYEILEQYPEFLRELTTIDHVRRTIQQEEYKSTWRDVEVSYIFGKTGTGKSRSIMEKFGYGNVFRVTDYLHPFDTYEGQETIVFEEFSSSIKIQDMLNYLDGYPLKLPARYSDKVACFTKAFIVSNIPLENQYENIQQERPEVWKAFLRRIKKIIHFQPDGSQMVYDSTGAYLDVVYGFSALPQKEKTPFDGIEESLRAPPKSYSPKHLY